MTKKPKFPLIMDGDERVRSVDELREHFSTARVMSYVSNGKLVTWLRDRNSHNLADAVEQLDKDDPELPRKITELFGLTYDEQDAALLQEDMEHNQRLDKLKEYTDDPAILGAVDCVAFNQAELDRLMDERKTTVYLCGERFTIPLDKGGVQYVGVNNPVAVIASETVVDLAQAGITLEGVRFNDEYQEVVEAAKKPKYSCAICRKLGGPVVGATYAIIFDEAGKQVRYIGAVENHQYHAVAANNTALFQCYQPGIGNKCKLRKISLNTLEEEQITVWDMEGVTTPAFAAASEKWLVIACGIILPSGRPDFMFQIINLNDMSCQSYTGSGSKGIDRDFVIIGDYLFVAAAKGSEAKGSILRIDLNNLEESKEILPASNCSIYGRLMTDDRRLMVLESHQTTSSRFIASVWLHVIDSEGNTISSKNIGKGNSIAGGVSITHSVYNNGFVYYATSNIGLVTLRKIDVETLDDTKIDVFSDSDCRIPHLFTWGKKLYVDSHGKVIKEYDLAGR